MAKTSAEQLHHGGLSPAPRGGSDERLFIDLDICASHQCPGCSVRCSYMGHPENNGIHSVAELATYALVCRRCEDPHCVNVITSYSIHYTKLYDCCSRASTGQALTQCGSSQRRQTRA